MAALVNRSHERYLRLELAQKIGPATSALDGGRHDKRLIEPFPAMRRVSIATEKNGRSAHNGFHSQIEEGNRPAARCDRQRDPAAASFRATGSYLAVRTTAGRTAPRRDSSFRTNSGSRAHRHNGPAHGRIR